MLAVPFVSARMQVTTHHILEETFLAITMSWLVRESLLGMRESQVETWCASYLLVCLNYHGSCKKSRLGQERGVFLALVFYCNVVFIRLLVSEILPPKRWNQCQQRGDNKKNALNKAKSKIIQTNVKCKEALRTKPCLQQKTKWISK